MCEYILGVNNSRGGSLSDLPQMKLLALCPTCLKGFSLFCSCNKEGNPHREILNSQPHYSLFLVVSSFLLFKKPKKTKNRKITFK